MALFHADLEGKIEQEYGIKDVIRNPTKSTFREIFQDLNYESLFPGSQKTKSRLNDLVNLFSFGFSAIPHELMHAGTNALLGGSNDTIVINKFFGGDLVHMAYSGIESKLLIPFIGGYVRFSDQSPDLAKFVATATPYAFTPVGVYLLLEGKKRKSLPLAAAGSGFVLSHAGAILGDFFNLGRNAVYETTNTVAHAFGNDDFSTSSSYAAFPLAILGFYLGSKLLHVTYRASKAGVSYCRNGGTDISESTADYLAKQEPRVKKFEYRSEPGTFASQKEDGAATFEFKDGAILDITLSHPDKNYICEISAVLNKNNDEFNVSSSPNGDSDSLKYTHEGNLNSEQASRYLTAANNFVHDKSSRKFRGKQWIKDNWGVYIMGLREIPYLVLELEDATRPTKYSK